MRVRPMFYIDMPCANIATESHANTVIHTTMDEAIMETHGCSNADAHCPHTWTFENIT